MMRVFRIETEKQEGICVSGTGICDSYHEACGLKLGCGKSSRFPDEDLADFRLLYDGWKCAFPSVETMLEWFPSEKGRAVMKSRGARLVEYEVYDFLETTDKQQLIYEPYDARLIQIYDLETLK